LNGIQEAVGSIPSSSTRKIKGLRHQNLRPFFISVTRTRPQPTLVSLTLIAIHRPYPI
jgi:hypothetical protein